MPARAWRATPEAAFLRAAKSLWVRCRPRRRVPGRGPVRRRRHGRCRSSWSPHRRPGLVGRADLWIRWGCGRLSSHDLHLDVVVAGGDSARRGRRTGAARRPGHAALDGARATPSVYVGVAQSVWTSAVAHCQARGIANLPPQRAGPNRAGRTRPSPPPVSSWTRRPGGSRSHRVTGDQPVGVAGEATRRHATAMDVRTESMVEAAGTSATPGTDRPRSDVSPGLRGGWLAASGDCLMSGTTGWAVAALGGDPRSSRHLRNRARPPDRLELARITSARIAGVWDCATRHRWRRKSSGRDPSPSHYAGVARGLAKRVFENSGVRTRHGVI